MTEAYTTLHILAQLATDRLLYNSLPFSQKDQTKCLKSNIFHDSLNSQNEYINFLESSLIVDHNVSSIKDNSEDISNDLEIPEEDSNKQCEDLEKASLIPSSQTKDPLPEDQEVANSSKKAIPSQITLSSPTSSVRSQDSSKSLHSETERCDVEEEEKSPFVCVQMTEEARLNANDCTHDELYEKKIALHCIEHFKYIKSDSKCCLCTDGKVFTASTSLLSHYRSHAGIKPFRCDVCEACFTRQHSLKYHKLIHQNLSRFTCSDCGRKFRHPSHFKEHKRQHTGETPYSCLSCNLWFKTRNTYKRHLRARHFIHLSAKKCRFLTNNEIRLMKQSLTSKSPQTKLLDEKTS